MSTLKINCLSRVPMTAETVERIYERQVCGRGYVGQEAIDCLIAVIMSHERLRAELEGCTMLLKGAREEERERCAKLIESGGDGIEGFHEMAIQLGANVAFAAYIRGMKSL